ncbi:MAG: HAMP domain-containing sensor histidine kinase [Clostridiaceae bacterium]|nr:HAMP domain-containing sensor histidine kinase [Clostridiaceae bacterium]
MPWLVNPAQRRLLWFFLLLLAIVPALSWMIADRGSRQIIACQTRQDMALVGYLTTVGTDDLDHQALQAILNGNFDDESVEQGRHKLAVYGLDDPETRPLTGRYQPIRRILLFGAGGLSLVLLLLGGAWFAGTLRQLFRQIRCLSDQATAASQDPSGKHGLTTFVTQEGDLGALRRAIAGLAEQSAGRQKVLSADKKYLQGFLSDISHQIKTPLASLRLYHELMLEQPSIPEPKRMDFIRLCLNQIERIEWLIQGLLKMARLDAGAVIMEKKLLPVMDTVRLAAAPFSEQARKENIRLICTVPEDIRLEHDPDWVAEAISNLIKNALEHTPSGGVIRIDAAQTPLSVQLQVSDTGEGLPTEEIPRIFERFYRYSPETRPNAVGIGLSLAKTIFTQNGADLSVKSRPGQGATFTATFLKPVGAAG